MVDLRCSNSKGPEKQLAIVAVNPRAEVENKQLNDETTGKSAKINNQSPMI
jgi:hypothetical protein